MAVDGFRRVYVTVGGVRWGGGGVGKTGPLWRRDGVDILAILGKDGGLLRVRVVVVAAVVVAVVVHHAAAAGAVVAQAACVAAGAGGVALWGVEEVWGVGNGWGGEGVKGEECAGCGQRKLS